MMVRCTKKDAWVTVGNDYAVLGIYGRGEVLKYRIVGDDGHTPALHDAELFDMTSSKILDGWIFRVYPNMEWEITPEAWATEGFWTAYFEGDSAAVDTFTKVFLYLKEQDDRY